MQCVAKYFKEGRDKLAVTSGVRQVNENVRFLSLGEDFDFCFELELPSLLRHQEKREFAT